MIVNIHLHQSRERARSGRARGTKLALSRRARSILRFARGRYTPPLMERVDAAIAIVFRGDRLLVCQRKDDDHLGGYWEFPGGKCEPGETLEQCLARELREELAITARPVARLSTIEHDYPHVQVRLHPFVCSHEHGEVAHIECQASRWIDPPALRDYRFPPANESLIEETIAFFATRSADGSPAPG